jgi:uncharacterized protein (DUF58 family)
VTAGASTQGDRPFAGDAALGALLDRLEVLPVPEGRTRLLPALTMRTITGHRQLVVVISDFLTDEAVLDRVPALLTKDHSVVFIHVIAVTEWTLPDDGLSRFIDVEGGENLEATVGPGLRAAYTAEVEAFIARLAESAAIRGVSFVSLRTDMSLEREVFGVLRAIGIVG